MLPMISREVNRRQNGDCSSRVIFPLNKMAHVACSDDEKLIYNNHEYVPKFDIQYCCKELLLISRKTFDLNDLLKICTVAAKFGHLDCLTYAHECDISLIINGTLYSNVNYIHLVKNRMYYRLDISLISVAVDNGKLECFKYTHKIGHVLDFRMCERAAAGGHLECLKFAFECGCPLTSNTSNVAAAGGHVQCLRFSYEHGGNISSQSVCSAAASNGHLEILKFLCEHKFPLNTDTCSVAAEHGHLNCLQYAHANGCPWDENTSYNAAVYGHLECLTYLCENGCPISSDTWIVAKKHKQKKCSTFALRAWKSQRIKQKNNAQ